MNFEHCPLCKGTLKRLFYETYVSVRCISCEYDGMSKFSVVYTPDGKTLTSSTWWFESDLYVYINYAENTTKISRITACILLDPILLDHAMEVDFEDPKKTAKRLDTLMIFS